MLKDLKNQITELTLVPSSGGIFEIAANGEVLFSKEKLGRFPNEGEALELTRKAIAR